MKSVKNIAFICTGIAAVLAVASCDVKIVNADYPSQKIYLPAAVESNIYTVDQANISTGSTPTPGNPYQFLIDYDEGTFTIPLSVYRSGINNDGAVNVDVWFDEELVYDAILNGELADDVEVITSDILLEDVPGNVVVQDGQSSAMFNVVLDYYYLLDRPDSQLAFGISIDCDDRELNEDASRLIVVIDTSIFNEL